MLVIESLGYVIPRLDSSSDDLKSTLIRFLTQTATAIVYTAGCESTRLKLSDLADYTEITDRRDFCSGEELTTAGRFISTGGILIGTSKFLRLVAKRGGITVTKGKAVTRNIVNNGGETAKLVESTKNIRGKMSNPSEVMPGTTIPMYFILKTDGAEFFVNTNAIKHMGKYK